MRSYLVEKKEICRKYPQLLEARTYMFPFKLSLVGSHSSHGMVEFWDEILKGGENVILQRLRGERKKKREKK